ncbi:MAG: hypothetical protein IKO44_04205 [Ruminococcus sp.]|nr:hypothetical protein [Ruminococcus sp.]
MRLKKLLSGAIAAAMSMAMLTMLPAKAAATDCTDTWVTNADGTYSFTASTDLDRDDLNEDAKILDLSRFAGDKDVTITMSVNGNFGFILGANDIVNGWKQEIINLGNEIKTFTVSAGEEGIDYLKIELLWINEGTTVTVEARVDETLDTWVINPNGTYSFTASTHLERYDLNEDAKILDLSRFAGDKDVTITMSVNGYFEGILGANDWKQEEIILENETQTITMSAGEEGIDYLKIELWWIEEGTTVTVDARVGETYVQLNTSKVAETGLFDERAVIELDETLVNKIDYVNFTFEGDLYDTVNNTITGTYNKTIKCTKYYTGIKVGDTVVKPAEGRVFVVATLRKIPRSKVPENIPFTYELHYAA